MQHESRSRRPSEPSARRPQYGEPEFWVVSEFEANAFVLSLYGELDIASAPELEKQVKRLQWDGASSIVLDLSGLDFIDSTGLHVLARAQRRSGDGGLTLLRGPRTVHRVFELTGMDELLPFAD
jgi:anti-sigma B factor antagonist